MRLRILVKFMRKNVFYMKKTCAAGLNMFKARAFCLRCVLTALILQDGGQSKVFNLCELANVLFYDHAVPVDQLAMWLCIAYYESAYNTSAVGPQAEDFGILQISRLFWCDPQQIMGNSTFLQYLGSNVTQQYIPNVCNISCSALLDDDISDDVTCAKRIHQEHEAFEGDGYKAWAVYPKSLKKGPLIPEWCFPEGTIPLNLSSKAYYE